MDRSFWQGRWDDQRLGWHVDDPNPILVEHIGRLTGGESARVLMPLCGKSVDLLWLARGGHSPVGVEMIERAVDDFFAEAELTVIPEGGKRCGGGVEIWIADFFEIDRAQIGAIDAVWDRGSLVALPPDRREAYRDQLRSLAPGAPILLSAIDYDPSVMTGPPFAITPTAIEALFDNAEKLAGEDVIDRSPRWQQAGHQWFHSLVYLIRP